MLTVCYVYMTVVSAIYFGACTRADSNVFWMQEHDSWSYLLEQVKYMDSRISLGAGFTVFDLIEIVLFSFISHPWSRGEGISGFAIR